MAERKASLSKQNVHKSLGFTPVSHSGTYLGTYLALGADGDASRAAHVAPTWQMERVSCASAQWFIEARLNFRPPKLRRERVAC